MTLPATRLRGQIQDYDEVKGAESCPAVRGASAVRGSTSSDRASTSSPTGVELRSTRPIRALFLLSWRVFHPDTLGTAEMHAFDRALRVKDNDVPGKPSGREFLWQIRDESPSSDPDGRATNRGVPESAKGLPLGLSKWV